MMEPHIHSISSNVTNNVRQDIFPLEQWTITTRKGIILQSRCTCQPHEQVMKEASPTTEPDNQDATPSTAKEDLGPPQIPPSGNDEESLCNVCRYYKALPQLHNMPDMLFNENLLELKHYTGLGIRFTALDALKLVKETKDPLQVAVSGEWQSARADFPYAKSVVKPFDWTFTTSYRGTLISTIRKNRGRPSIGPHTNTATVAVKAESTANQTETKVGDSDTSNTSRIEMKGTPQEHSATLPIDGERVEFLVEETDERIDVNKLKVREDILFYADVPLYEDELADHGTAQYTIKVRVMPKSLFILARFYLRIDNVLARINDTRIYHESNKKYLLREYTNREAKLSSLKLPVSILINPNELMNHLPIVQSRYEKLHLPSS